MRTQEIPGRKTLASAVAAIVTLACGSSLAHEPWVDIVSPVTGDTLFCASFPCPTAHSIDIEIEHATLSDLNVFKVEVNGVSILHDGTEAKAEVGSPFRNAPPASANTCSGQLVDVTTACSTNGGPSPAPGNFAELSVAWTPQEPGIYTIVASVRHTSTTGSDEETVTLATLSAEHPAPPAVANAWLNENFTRRELSGQVRGCIIQQIAQKHAASEYGPRGGPYDIPTIEQDAYSYFAPCQ